MIIIAYTIAIFGTDRVDIGYCNVVADVLEKKHSFYLPTRGALDTRNRSWAKILKDPAEQVPIGSLEVQEGGMMLPCNPPAPRKYATRVPPPTEGRALQREAGPRVGSDNMCSQGKAMLDTGLYPYMGTSNTPSKGNEDKPEVRALPEYKREDGKNMIDRESN